MLYIVEDVEIITRFYLNDEFTVSLSFRKNVDNVVDANFCNIIVKFYRYMITMVAFF